MLCIHTYINKERQQKINRNESSNGVGENIRKYCKAAVNNSVAIFLTFFFFLAKWSIFEDSKKIKVIGSLKTRRSIYFFATFNHLVGIMTYLAIHT